MENEINFNKHYNTYHKNFINKGTLTRTNSFQNCVNTPNINTKSNPPSTFRTINNSSAFNRDIHNFVSDMNLIQFKRKRAPHIFSTKYIPKNSNTHVKTYSNNSSSFYKNKYISKKNIISRNSYKNNNQNTILKTINKNELSTKYFQYSNNNKLSFPNPLNKTNSTFKKKNIILTLGDFNNKKSSIGDKSGNFMSLYEYNLLELKNKHSNTRKKILNNPNNKNVILDYKNKNNCYSKNELKEYYDILPKFLTTQKEKNSEINDKSTKSYTENIINKITRELLLLNEKNEEITKGKIINLLEKENITLNNYIDKYLNSLCQIKNFSFLSVEKNNSELLSKIYPILNKIISFSLNNNFNIKKTRKFLSNKIYENINNENELFELNNKKFQRIMSKELKSFDLNSFYKQKRKNHLHNFNYEIPEKEINKTTFITKVDKKIGVNIYNRKYHSHYNLINVLKLEKISLSESRKSKSVDSKYSNQNLNAKNNFRSVITKNKSVNRRSFGDYLQLNNMGDLRNKLLIRDMTIKKSNRNNEKKFSRKIEEENEEKSEKIEIRNPKIKNSRILEQYNGNFNKNNIVSSKIKINIDNDVIEKFKIENKKTNKKIFLNKNIEKNSMNIKKNNELIDHQKLKHKYNKKEKKATIKIDKKIKDENDIKSYVSNKKINIIKRELEKPTKIKNYSVNYRNNSNKILNIKFSTNPKTINNNNQSSDSSEDKKKITKFNEGEKEKNSLKVSKKKKAKQKKKEPFFTKEKMIFLGRRLLGIDGNLNFSKKIMDMLYGIGAKKEYGSILFPPKKNDTDSPSKDLNQYEGNSNYYEGRNERFKKRTTISPYKKRRKRKNGIGDNGSESKEEKDKVRGMGFNEFKKDQRGEEIKDKFNFEHESNEKDYLKMLINQINKIKKMSVKDYVDYLERVFNSGEQAEKLIMTKQERINLFLDTMRKDIEIDKSAQKTLEDKYEIINYIESIGNKLATSIDK